MEALQRAYQNLGQLRDADAFRGWLGQIARRVCWHLRSREALLPLLQLTALEETGTELAAGAPGPEAEAAMRETRAILYGAIAELPAELRDVYQLRDIEERSGEEVAERLGLSLGAMKSRLHRARALLRSTLDQKLSRRTHYGNDH